MQRSIVVNSTLFYRSSTQFITLSAFMVLALGLGCESSRDATGLVFDAPVDISTPSVEKVRETQVEMSDHRRPFRLTPVSAKDGAVTHSPLYFEDPSETPGERLSFEWTGDDYFHLLYGPARFLASTFLFPISAVDAPPWELTQSDGQFKNDPSAD